MPIQSDGIDFQPIQSSQTGDGIDFQPLDGGVGTPDSGSMSPTNLSDSPPRLSNRGVFDGLGALQKASNFFKGGLDAGASVFRNTFKAGMGATKTFIGEAAGLLGQEDLSRKILAPIDVPGVGEVRSFSVDPRDADITGAASAQRTAGVAAGMIPEAFTAYSLTGGALPTASTAGGRIADASLRGGGLAGLTAFSEAMQQEKGLSEVLNDTTWGSFLGALLGGGFQVGIEGANWVATKLPAKIMNTAIRAQNKEFAFGKNPGKGMLDAKVEAWSVEDMDIKVKTSLNETGKQIRDVILDLPDDKVIDTKPVLDLIDDKIQKATSAREQSLVNRLREIRLMITNISKLDDAGEIITGQSRGRFLTPEDAFEIKQQITEKTKWSWRADSGDTTVNKLLKNVYGAIKDQINKVAEKSGNGELITLNEQYANLASARSAIGRLTAQMQRLDALADLSMKITGIGAVGFLIEGLLNGKPNQVKAAAGTLTTAALTRNPVILSQFAALLNKMTPTEQQWLADGATQPVRDLILNILSRKVGEATASGVNPSGDVEGDLPPGFISPPGGDTDQVDASETGDVE